MKTKGKTAAKTTTGAALEKKPRSKLVKGGGSVSKSPKKKKGKKGKKKPGKMAATKRGAKVKDKKGGDPVSIYSGAVVDERTDFRLPGRIRVELTRFYSSHWGEDDLPFGRCGWTHSYHVFAEALPKGDPSFADEWRFRDDDGRWVELGELPLKQVIFARPAQLEILRTETTLRLYSAKTRLTRELTRERTDEPYRLQRIVDPRGNAVEIHWRGANVDHIVDTAKRQVRFVYDSAARITRIGVWVGEIEHQWVDFGYHDTGELAWSRNAAGHCDRFEYNGLHWLVRRTLRNGVSFNYEYADDGRCVRTYGDDGLHTWNFLRDDEKGEVVCTGTAESKVFVFDDMGELVEERTIDGQFKRTWEFDEDGLVVAEANGLGHTTTYELDDRGHPVKMIDPAGNETIWEYAQDVLRRRVEPDGLVFSYAHNSWGELTESRSPTGDRYALDYDEYGRLIAIYGLDGVREKRAYDDQHNLIAVTTSRGALWSFTYDPLGRVLTRTDADGNVTRLERNQLGLPVLLRSADGTTTRIEYGPLDAPVRMVDALGREVRREYGGTGVLLKQTMSDGSDWLFSYDRDERLVQILNPKKESHQFAYDRAGRVEREDTFDGRIIRYAWDPASRLRQMVSNGAVHTYSHDRYGGVTSDASPEGAQIYERDRFGRIMRAVVEDGPEEVEVVFERDEFGRVVRDTHGGISVEHVYDVRGRRIERRVLGETTKYRYDLDDALSGVDHQGRRLEIARDRMGRDVRRLWQGRTAVDSHYDAIGRLTDQRVIGPALGGGTDVPVDAAAEHVLGPLPEGFEAWRVLSQRRWEYDPVDRITTSTDRTWGQTTYRYDNLDNLLAAERRRHHEAFEYDAAASVVHAMKTLVAAGS